MFAVKTAKLDTLHGPQYLLKRISQGLQLDLSIGENKQINCSQYPHPNKLYW